MIDDEKTTAADINQQPGTMTDPSLPSARNAGAGNSGNLPLANEDADLGHALRSIYQQTIEEAVPDEMLDLLSRLG